MCEKKKSRPSWDRYFMDIAHVAASRSNCSRRQVAAVVVRDKQIISTGYNGTPRGIKTVQRAVVPAAIPMCQAVRDCTSVFAVMPKKMPLCRRLIMVSCLKEPRSIPPTVRVCSVPK